MAHGTRIQIVIPEFKMHTLIGVDVLKMQNLHTLTFSHPHTKFSSLITVPLTFVRATAHGSTTHRKGKRKSVVNTSTSSSIA